MKAQELRIGNYLTDTDENRLYQIIEIESKAVRVVDEDGEDYYIHISNLKPIPLTEDILLKCGFDRQSIVHIDKSVTPIAYMGKFGIRAQWYSEKSLEEINTGELMICKNDSLLCVINYLHQLQNLDFALTGKELTFKQE